MPKLRNLSGQDVLKILGSFGFTLHSQKGSHVKLRQTVQGSQQTLTVALHDEIDKGTLRAIFRQASRYIADAELRPHFYTED